MPHVAREEQQPAPYARACCPPHALAELTADELAALDRFCRRALDDPEAEPIGEEEIAAAERYQQALLASGATVYTGRPRRRADHSG